MKVQLYLFNNNFCKKFTKITLILLITVILVAISIGSVYALFYLDMTTYSFFVQATITVCSCIGLFLTTVSLGMGIWVSVVLSIDYITYNY